MEAKPTAQELREAADRLRETANAASNQAAALRAQARKAEREERQAKEAKENAEHFDRMYAEIGQPLAGLNREQHGIVYAAAWESGHASGYSEVEIHYGELAEMARKILDAS